MSSPPLTEYVGTRILFRWGLPIAVLGLVEGVIFPRPAMSGAVDVVIATVAFVAFISVVSVAV